MKTRSYLLILFLGIAFPLFSQDPALDSLKAELKKPMHDTLRLDILFQLKNMAPEGEWQIYNRQMAGFCEKLLKQKNLSPDLYEYYTSYLASAYCSIGEEHSMSNTDSALFWFKKSLPMAEKANQQHLTGKILYYTGNIYAFKGDFKRASADLYKALKIYESRKDKKETADILISIGDLYHLQNEEEPALANFKKALACAEEINNPDRIITAVNYIGLIYLERHDYVTAKKYYLRALPILNERHFVSVNNRIGYIIENEGFLDSAVHYYKRSFEACKETDNKPELHECYLHLSNVYLKLKKYPLSKTYGTLALRTATELQYKNLMATTYHLLYRVYKAMGRPDSSLAMYEKHIQFRDSLQSEVSKKNILEQKLKYEFEKKEAVAKAENESRLKLLKAEQEKESKIKNMWILLFVSLSILLLAGSCFLYVYFKQKNLISVQKNDMLQQKLQLSQMNPHFIFNSLNAIQNYIFKEDKLNAGLYLSQFSELIRMILNFSRKDYITLESEEKFLNNYLELQHLRFTNKLQYMIRIDPEIDKSHVLLPPMLAQPFIENSIEHGIMNKEGKGTISISFHLENDLLIYEIVDDGIGLERSLQIRKEASPGHESLGTLITRERIRDLNIKNKKNITLEIADIGRTSPDHQGVSVKFSVPYKTI